MLSEFLLNPGYIVEINSKILKVKDPIVRFNSVESAFASIDYYKSNLEKLCSVYRSIIKNHPFYDGNKRTAAIYLIIGLKELGLYVDQDLICDLTLDVTTHQYEVEEIAKKLQSIIYTK